MSSSNNSDTDERLESFNAETDQGRSSNPRNTAKDGEET